MRVSDLAKNILNSTSIHTLYLREQHMVKVAYLIQAHNNFLHLSRLIGSLAHEEHASFIHIDRKTSGSLRMDIRSPLHVQLTSEIDVKWGDITQVLATLHLIRHALSQSRKFDYFVLISGTCFPIRSQSYINNYLSDRSGQEFINIVAMPNSEAGKPISRLINRRLMSDRAEGIEGGDLVVGLRGMKPYGGSSWWGLSRSACEYIINFIDDNPFFLDFYSETFCPDESFFQTILGNSRFSDKLTRNFTYADWSKGGPNPSNIDRQHLDLLVNTPFIKTDIYGTGEILFARKFNDLSHDLLKELNLIS